MALSLSLQDCCVSETTGFVMENPLAKLPAYFEPWNKLAAEMPQLVTNGTMRQRIQQLELLDWTRLSGQREKRLAHWQLVILAAGFVWQDGEQEAAKVLPACVAVPLCGVSRDLGLRPILGHADLALANCRPTDPAGPLELLNLSAIYRLPGGKEADWFITVTVAIELAFAKGIKSVLAAVEGGKRGDERMVTDSLVHLTRVVQQMQNNLSRMHENLSAATFFNTLRPFLGGWGGESNPLPDGLIYEGVSEEPAAAVGGSAAQSGTIQVLDALLGVKHSLVVNVKRVEDSILKEFLKLGCCVENIFSQKKSFLLMMRSYMLPGHRRFIDAVEEHSQDLQSMVKSSTSDELTRAYNSLLSAVVSFRTYHIQIVTKYIVQAACQAKRAENKFDSLDNKGTGGTDLLPFLKELRQDTRDSMVTAQSTCHEDL